MSHKRRLHETLIRRAVRKYYNDPRPMQKKHNLMERIRTRCRSAEANGELTPEDCDNIVMSELDLLDEKALREEDPEC